jgi:hypothetical protein
MSEQMAPINASATRFLTAKEGGSAAEIVERNAEGTPVRHILEPLELLGLDSVRGDRQGSHQDQTEQTVARRTRVQSAHEAVRRAGGSRYRFPHRTIYLGADKSGETPAVSDPGRC